MTSRPNIKTARRIGNEYNVNLSKRRNWYTDPPASDPPAPPTPPVVPPTPDPKGEAKFTQAELDAIAGRTRKEAADSARKALLKELGLDPDDPKAVDTVKGRLTAAQKAEDDKKTAEQKLQEQLDALTKERDDAKADREKVLQEQLLEKRDNKVLAALQADEFNCRNPQKLFKLLKADHPEMFDALLKEDGTIDMAKLTPLAELGKKENPEYFGPKYAIGTQSHGGGRSSETDDRGAKQASLMNQQRIRG